MSLAIAFEECIGCGVCVQICPEVFALDEEAGKAEIAGAAVVDLKRELVEEAIDSCPVGCINE